VITAINLNGHIRNIDRRERSGQCEIKMRAGTLTCQNCNILILNG
jgi:hypothetical protein